MSRTRKGTIDDKVADLATRISDSPQFRDLILQTIQDGDIDESDQPVYAAAVTQAMAPGLKRLGRAWLEEAEESTSRTRAELSPRTRVGQLLGVARQSVDAAFGFYQRPDRLRKIG